MPLTGEVDVLYWGVSGAKPGHVSLLIRSNLITPEVLSTLPRSMHLQTQRCLYVSFYPGGSYRPYHHDTDPTWGYGGREPDAQICLESLDVERILSKIKDVVNSRPTYSALSSTGKIGHVSATDAPTSTALPDKHNCVTTVLELLLAGGVGRYISVWTSLERARYHFRAWMPSRNSLGWMALASFLSVPAIYFSWSRTVHTREIFDSLLYQTKKALGSYTCIGDIISDGLAFFARLMLPPGLMLFFQSLGFFSLKSETPSVLSIFMSAFFPIQWTSFMAVFSTKLNEKSMEEAVTTLPSCPRGLFLRLAKIYGYSPLILLGLLGVAGLVFFYSSLIGIDGIKKLFISTPADILELTQKIASMEAHQASMIALQPQRETPNSDSSTGGSLDSGIQVIQGASSSSSSQMSTTFISAIPHTFFTPDKTVSQIETVVSLERKGYIPCTIL